MIYNFRKHICIACNKQVNDDDADDDEIKRIK